MEKTYSTPSEVNIVQILWHFKLQEKKSKVLGRKNNWIGKFENCNKNGVNISFKLNF